MIILTRLQPKLASNSFLVPSSEAEVIINTFKAMNAECSQIQLKIQELGLDKEEHRLVVTSLTRICGSSSG